MARVALQPIGIDPFERADVDAGPVCRTENGQQRQFGFAAAALPVRPDGAIKAWRQKRPQQPFLEARGRLPGGWRGAFVVHRPMLSQADTRIVWSDFNRRRIAVDRCGPELGGRGANNLVRDVGE